MLDYHANLTLNRALADSAGLRVEYFDPDPGKGKDNCPRTDGKTIFVPKPSPDFSLEDWEKWKESNFHEIGHNMPENRGAFELLEKENINTRSNFGFSLNICEDSRVDLGRCIKYPGMMMNHEKVTWRLVEKLAAGDLQGFMDSDQDAWIALTILAHATYARSMWAKSLRGFEERILAKLPQKALDAFQILKKDYTERLLECRTPEETLEYTREIFREVFKKDPESEKKPENAEADDEGDGDGSKEGEGSGESEGSENGEESQDSGKNPKKKSKKKMRVRYEDLLVSQHVGSDPDSDARLGGLEIDYSSYASVGAYTPHTDATNQILDWTAGAPTEKWDEKSSLIISAYEIEQCTQDLNLGSLASEARRLLQVMTRKRTSFNQKRGRIDSNKVYRVCQPESSVSDRIFKVRTESKALDTAVSILVDYSGSMCGEKVITAIAAAQALHEIMQVLRINCEVAGFTEHSPNINYHHVFKEFGKSTPLAKFQDGMLKATRKMSGNADGDNILIAYSRILRQRNRRKVLLVLSDGSPASCWGDVYSFTKKVIREIEKDRRVEIFGMGIQNNNVTRLYKNNRVIWNIEDLPKALIELLEKIILL